MSKKILVILAGCGAKDGSEIHESVLTLLAIDKAGATYQCAAPNIKQAHVLNFIDNSEINQERNVLIESARISRGKILDLANVSMKDYDALVIPGGFGAAKNLCTFAFDGIEAKVNSEVSRIIEEAYNSKKPIAAICIAPAIIALSLAKINPNITLTLGTEDSANQNLTDIGVKSKSCLTTSFVADEANKIISTPAYMHSNSRISELEQGISEAIQHLITMCHQTVAA